MTEWQKSLQAVQEHRQDQRADRRVMSLAVLSDIHANLPALTAVLADAGRRGAERVVVAGDLVGYGPYPEETINLLREQSILCVQGNYDDAVAHTRPVCGCDFVDPREEAFGMAVLQWTQAETTPHGKEYLAGLPVVRTIALGPYTVAIVHGSPWRSNQPLGGDTPVELLEQALDVAGADILIAGHTHCPIYRRVGRRHFFNAGTVGRPQPGGSHEAGYLLLTAAMGALNAGFIYLSYDQEELICGLSNNLVLAPLLSLYR